MAFILFPNGRKQYVLRQKSTDSLIQPKFREYPNAVEDSPIIGLDDDLEFLAVDKDFEPDFDPRLVALVPSEAKEDNLWHISFDLVKKDLTQIKFAVINAESQQVNLQLANENLAKLTILGLGVLFSLKDNNVLTTTQQAIKDRVLKANTALLQNDAVVAQLNAIADAGGTPDLDNVWAAKL